MLGHSESLAFFNFPVSYVQPSVYKKNIRYVDIEMENIDQELIEHPVRVGEVYAAKDTRYIISAIGLGSCVSVVAFDPTVNVGGIAHIQLPDSTEMSSSKSRRPFANADKGIPELFNTVETFGGHAG